MTVSEFYAALAGHDEAFIEAFDNSMKRYDKDGDIEVLIRDLKAIREINIESHKKLKEESDCTEWTI